MTSPLGNHGFFVNLVFHGDLHVFLGRNRNAPVTRRRRLKEKTGVKDVLEACGVPHPEVDLILVNEKPRSFAYAIDTECQIDVHPPSHPRPGYELFRLQKRRFTNPHFVVDVHLGRLVRHLRWLGLDTEFDSEADDRDLVARLGREDAVLLTRDRALLMHRRVRHGYFPRSQQAGEQVVEILTRFDLAAAIKPFSRCVECGGELMPVPKAAIEPRLEPKTKLYYHQFKICRQCNKIYWKGSHWIRMQARLDSLNLKSPLH